MNIKLTPLAKLLAVTACAILFIDACSCKTCGLKTDSIEVPDFVFEQTDKLIVERVGKDFFKKYIHADYLASKKKRGKYEVRYNFRMLDYNFVDEKILIITDTTGNLYQNSKAIGIPVCVLEDNGCDFVVDKERAIEIGVENNLPEGIKEWAVEFRWSEAAERYIWHVIATTREFGEGESYKASGEEMMINPVTGEVLKQRKWNIF